MPSVQQTSMPIPLQINYPMLAKMLKL
jgi:hypothetical protein